MKSVNNQHNKFSLYWKRYLKNKYQSIPIEREVIYVKNNIVSEDGAEEFCKYLTT